MIDDLGKLLDRASFPADLAVLLLSGPLAYVLDAGLDIVGFLPPGYVAIAASSVVLGVKKAFEAQLGRRDVLRRADALSEQLAIAAAPAPLLEQIRSELRLYRGRVTTRPQLEEALDDCVSEYRAWLRAEALRQARAPQR